MKDDKNREKGKYIDTFTKEREGIIYTMIETVVIGQDSEIINYQREYNPGIRCPMTWEEI